MTLERRHVRARAAGTLLLSAAVGIGMHRLGGSGAPTPPLGDVHELHAWIEQHGTVVAAVSALRLVAIALAVYVASIAALSLVMSFAALPRTLDRAVRRITPRTLRAALGLGVVSVVALPLATPAGALVAEAPVLVAVDDEPQPGPPPVLEWVDDALAPAPTPPTTATTDPPPSSTSTTAVPGIPSAPPTTAVPRIPSAPPTSPAPPITAAPPTSAAPPTTARPDPMPPSTTAPSGSTPRSSTPSDHLPPTPRPHAPQPSTLGERTWEVRRGDHFWAIADAVVREQHPNATEAEVARYWRTLIEANRDRLVVPGNADLILPGQVLTVPAMR